MSFVGEASEDSRLLSIDGEVWRVYELGPQYDRRGSSLVFESVTLVRRVRNYPSYWRSLPDTDLALLMEQL